MIRNEFVSGYAKRLRQTFLNYFEYNTNRKNNIIREILGEVSERYERFVAI